MAVKDSGKQVWSDPKDYGLPWVEIKPLKPKSEVVAPKVEPVEKIQTEVEKPVSAPEPVIETPKVIAKEEKKPAQEKKTTSEKPAKATPKKEAKSSGSWVWIVVVFALLLVSAIIWQLQTGNQSELPVQEKSVPAANEPVITTAPEQSNTEIASAEETQASETQEAKENIPVENPNISKPTDSGTTIANNVSGKLIRIEAQEERPQYFIVVGSLPNEADALKLAPNYQAKSAEVYLILPYAESSNFRLAIGKYRSFRVAAEELEKIKSQYTEELWILKY
ncbi:hypothetical protein DFQ04_0605 [Algoriphagus boseongensis]|uniref:SPOR domain-containing protein n=1 Tax=Algoriphagus boseongensis TaxID=1442587 RepID=A0A4V3D2G3_9BACT|nr:hypothetical protein [Algoriphagus boseongensis]TDQ18797.1 hypothetical protein DFQ04_0605 [Algoriphagus boseongensis]